MYNLLDFFSILFLISAFLLVARKRITSYIITFRLQSVILGVVAGMLGVNNLLTEGAWDLLVVCAVIVVLKVWYIPHLLEKTMASVEYKVEKDFYLNIPISILICCILVTLTYFSISGIRDISDDHVKVYLVNSISVMLIGLFFMVSRKKALGQIIGFLVIENGLFTAAMLSTHGMPILVDLGIFVDLLTAVMIMGALVFRINENFDSIDLNKLKKLRG